MSETRPLNGTQLSESAVAFAKTEESGSHLREEFLANFAKGPEDDSVWQEAYTFAQREEEAGESEYSEYKDISTVALIDLSKRVRTIPDFRGRYKLMTETAPNGKIWFDVLTGFSSPEIEQGIDTYLARKLEIQDGRKFRAGADLGCGTGRVAEILAKYCDHTAGIDASPEMIATAKSRSGDKIDYVEADVTKMPFDDESVDVMTAIGVTGALNSDEQISFFSEVAHVLKDGGILIDGQWEKDSSQSAVIKLSWKNVLADMIVDTVSGKYSITRRLNGHQIDDLMKQIGLARTRHSYSWVPGMSLVVYEKDLQKLKAQHSGYSKSWDV